MISQYEKLTQEYTKLSQMHEALKEKKEQFRGHTEEDSGVEIANHMRGSTVAISPINGDASFGANGCILDTGVMMFLLK
jgi:hypothetical protein